MCLMTTAATNFTFFQASNVEEPRLRGKLPDQAAGAEDELECEKGKEFEDLDKLQVEIQVTPA